MSFIKSVDIDLENAKSALADARVAYMQLDMQAQQTGADLKLVGKESKVKDFIEKNLKFATFYTAVTGNNSLADVSIYSINPSNGIL